MNSSIDDLKNYFENKTTDHLHVCTMLLLEGVVSFTQAKYDLAKEWIYFS